MFFVNIAFVLIYIMLAVLSRKHFSKYKNKDKKINCVVCLFCGMGELLWNCLGIKRKNDEIQRSLRKCHVASQTNLNEMEKEWYVKGFALTLGILFFFNLLSGIMSLGSIMDDKKGDIEITRDGYGGYEEEYAIRLNDGKKEEEYYLVVAPVEYSPEDINKKAEDVFLWLEENVYGENTDAAHLKKDLYFPAEDMEGIFEISWRSDNPMLITSRGRVLTENIDSPVSVNVTATLHYMDYVFEKQFIFSFSEDKREKTNVEYVKEALDSLEEGSRNEINFSIPKSIDGVDITVNNRKVSLGRRIFGLGIVMSIGIMFVRRENLKNEIKKRDDLLLEQYPVLVNKLYLLLQTGMTLKNVFIYLTGEYEEASLLRREIQFSLNQLASGIEEGRVYKELGERLNLPEYVRLMNKISNNIKRGNSNLLESMKEEADMVFEARKENAKKLGEEASTKLIFPMIVLLLAVMLIILVPGFSEL